MGSQTADEAKATNVAAMGEPLGALYSALWQSVALLHVHWKEYVELFGSKPERIDLLNRAAPAFFHMLQDELWELALLRISRPTSESRFDLGARINGAVSLLYVLNDGVKEAEAREKRLEEGKPTPDDLRHDHI